jgi:hypothetical protein
MVPADVLFVLGSALMVNDAGNGSGAGNSGAPDGGGML